MHPQAERSGSTKFASVVNPLNFGAKSRGAQQKALQDLHVAVSVNTTRSRRWTMATIFIVT
jgi:hypothetical protein